MKFSLAKKIFIIAISALMIMVALPYSYSSDINTVKAAITTSDGFVFQNGIITGYEGTSTIVNIPAEISGQTVTAISGAFNRNHDIIEVIIPEGVETINGEAFTWCLKLESITIPSTVTTIEAASLANCKNLASINLSPENTSFILDADNALYNSEQTQLIQYVNTSAATSFIVPETVTSILDYAFGYSNNLVSITVHDAVTDIGEGAFTSCASLTSITIDSGNTNYMSQSGVLFSKDGKTLMCYPANKAGASYTIPSTVTILANVSFMGSENLIDLSFNSSVAELNMSLIDAFSIQNVLVPETNTTFSSIDGVLASKDGTTIYYYPTGKTNLEYIVPDSVTTIGSTCFFDQPNIQNIILHENVSTIGLMAIIECNSLNNIVIYGMETTFDIFAITSNDNLSIVGYANSTAQQYSELFGIPFYTMGKVSEWEYDVITSTTCDITKYIGTDTDVYVPSIIDGKYVDNISVTTFDDCSEIEYITFCESISSIEVANSDGSMYMFEDCISLTEIYFPSTLDTIITNGAPETPFKGTISLVNIIVDDDNSTYYDNNGVLFTSSDMLLNYPNGRTSSNYSIPEGTRNIHYSAFNNIYLKTVTVPGTVTELIQGPEPTFKNNIETVYLNEGVEVVEDVFSSSTPMDICFPESTIYISGFDVGDIHTFYVFENSVAHTYAVDNNIEYLFLCLITFDSNGGSSVEPKIVTANSPIPEPTSVKREGFVLQGWFTDSELTNEWSFNSNLATSSMTLYAKWAEGYSIIYHLNGGVNNAGNPPYYLVNQTVILKDPTKTNYLFDGWYTDPSCALKYKYVAIEKGTTGVVELWADWWVNSTTGSSGDINSSILITEKQPEITYKNFPGSVLYMQDNQKITVKGSIIIQYGDLKDVSVYYSGKTEKLYKYQDGDKRIATFNYSHSFNIGEIDYSYTDNYKITVVLDTMQTYNYTIPIYKSVLMTEIVGSYNDMIYFNSDKVYELRSMAVSGNYFETVNSTFENLTPEICEIKNGNILVPKAAGLAEIQTKIVLEDGSVIKYTNLFTISDKTIQEPSELERKLQCQCYGQYCNGFPENGIDPNLISLLEKIEEEIGSPVYIISGYRCEEYNQIFGGNENSEHVHGTAADIWVQGMTMDELYEICDRLNENGGVGKYSDHVHVDTRGENLRWDDAD